MPHRNFRTWHSVETVSLLHQNFGRQPSFIGLQGLKTKAAFSFAWSLFTRQGGLASQKTEILVKTSVKSSNLALH
jgi:hypothetical protein